MVECLVRSTSGFSIVQQFPSETANTIYFETVFDLPKLAPNTHELEMPDWIAKTVFLGADEAPQQTFALLDAASIPNLTTMLEASQSEFVCLYQGQSYDDLAEAAPWLVRLDWNDRFTRDIFTSSDAPWHLFDKSTLLFFRTASQMDDLRNALRKLTMIQGPDDKSYFLRFWEGLTLFSLLQDDFDKSICGVFHGGDVVMSPQHRQDQTNLMIGVFHAESK